jgi:hypothetical protein
MAGMILGSAGVLLLLLAFVLNLLRVLTESSALYLGMNLVGAGLAAVYAFTTGSTPFVILESVWAVAALVRLLQGRKKAPA